MIRLYMFCFAAVISMSACATIDPQQIADLQAKENVLARQKRIWQEKAEIFRAKGRKLSQEAILLSNHPGWPDMRQILMNHSSIKDLEGEEQAILKKNVAMINWTVKWQTNAAVMHNKWRALVDRILTLEKSFSPLRTQRYELSRIRLEIIENRLQLGIYTGEAWLRMYTFYDRQDAESISELIHIWTKPMAILYPHLNLRALQESN